MDLTLCRWQQAQVAESSYWRQATEDTLELLRITHEKADAVQWAQRAAKNILDMEGPLIEVGIGPLGVGCIHFLPKSASVNRKLVGIDPLLRTDVDLDLLPVPIEALIQACHSKNYLHLQGMGENICLPSDWAALAACYNVLDHCQTPPKVIEEITRVLKPGGHVILGCDVYSQAGLMKYRSRTTTAKILGVRLDSIGDLAHPHQFVATDLENLVLEKGLKILAANIRRFEFIQRICSHSYRMLIVARKNASAG